MQKVYTKVFFIQLLLDLLLGYQRDERLYFLNWQWNSNFLVDTKRCVCSNKNCVRSFAACADLNWAGLCWLSFRRFSDAVMMIFSGQSVISRLYTSRLVRVWIAWNLGRGGTKKVLGTSYCTQWKTPQKWTIPYRTMQWKSAISEVLWDLDPFYKSYSYPFPALHVITK